MYDLHAPIKNYTIKKGRYAPWITDNIKLMQKLREKALKKFKSSGAPAHWTYYKQLRNLTTTAIKSEKKAYLRHKFQNCNIKDKWRELKKLNIVKNKNIEIPDNLKNADAINNFFITSNNSPPNDDLIKYYSNNIKQGVTSIFSFELTNEFTVANVINNMKSTAFGTDTLNLTLIQLCCPFIIPFVTHIINECIITKYFPMAWKQAKVIPLPKINQPSEFSHLRSISILPVLSKVFEKIMELQIRVHLNINNILPIKQSGFRQGYSCATALLDILDDIIKASDESKISILILLDYSKAFDMINHTILKSILHFVGFGESAGALLSSYLTDRYQQVQLYNITSEPLNVSTGVPQGSILGPLLYTVYTSAFNESLKFCKYHFYADDTQIYCSFSLRDLHESNELINNDLNALVSTSVNHLLKINPSKSCAILFSSENIRNNVMNELSLHIGNEAIPFKNCIKSLGLLIDHKLRFKEHITTKLQKAYLSLKLIYSQRHFLGHDIKKNLCESLVLSQFNHCDCVYGPCLDSTDVRRIQKVQNSCLRLIYGIRRCHRISHKLQDIGWLSMYNRRELHMTCTFYKILKLKSPPYLHNKLKFRTDVHNINIRRKHILTIPQHRKEIFKRSFSYNMAICMNKINDVNFNLSHNAVKIKIKKHLFQNQ